MNFKSLSLGHMVITGSGILALVSMFLKWADFDFMGYENGFQNFGFILLALFVYPLVCVFKNKPVNKILGVSSSVVGMIATFLHYTHYGVNFFGTYMNFSSTGLYLFLLSVIGLLVGTFLQKANKKDLVTEEEVVTDEITAEEVTENKEEEKTQ